MYLKERLPVRPTISLPVVMPINVLLAVPEYITSSPSVPIFDLPAAINDLMGSSGWESAVKVMNPRVWAPGWNDEQLKSFVTAPFGSEKRAFPERGLKNLREKHFPGQQRRANILRHNYPQFEVVHFIGNIRVGSILQGLNEPILRLDYQDDFDRRDDFVTGRILLPGTLRDALVAAGTRLLILQVANPAMDLAVRFGQLVVGGGGPAVLIVSGNDAQALNSYFLNLYANIIHNRPLPEIAEPSGVEIDGEELSLYLIYGEGSEDLLRFDHFRDVLYSRLDYARDIATESIPLFKMLENMSPYLHRSQIYSYQAPIRTAEGETRALATNVFGKVYDLSRNLLYCRRELDFSHETGGALPLVEISEVVPQVEETANEIKMASGEVDYSQIVDEEIQRDLDELARHAPRVLNSNFVEIETGNPIRPTQALIAGEEYNLRLDVGPRWDKIVSIVKGNDVFPEAALPPDKDGYLIKVVLISDDFKLSDNSDNTADEPTDTTFVPLGEGAEVVANSFEAVDIEVDPADIETAPGDETFIPSLATAWMWIPRNSGRSYPVVNGQRNQWPGSITFRLRAPSFAQDFDEDFLTARGRISLYYENNLLQSAVVSVGVARSSTNTVLLVANEINVDFVLSSSFQEIERFARRTMKTEAEGEADYGVALNITLNDDGSNKHRLIVENHTELTAWRHFDPDATKDILEDARSKLLECFWMSNAQTCKVEQSNVNDRVNGLGSNGVENGKIFRQFKCDLWRLALLGRRLYTQALLQVETSKANGRWQTWERNLRQALTSTSVIQVARTGPAQYVYPWALLYDIPLPHKKELRWCDVLKEWSDPTGLRQMITETGEVRDKPFKDSCPYGHYPEHQQNTLCPYGFWGLKHYIEQPLNLYDPEDGAKTGGPPAKTPNIISSNGSTRLAVGVTRDTALNGKAIAAHLSNIWNIAAFVPVGGADTFKKVCDMLASTDLVYFLCHGMYDAARKQPYLGVGLNDKNSDHRVYPEDLLDWVTTLGDTLWKDHHPLIFINGCHTSNLKPGEILNFVSTFAQFGASGIIGTEVNVRLQMASEVAEKLLVKIANGTRVGEALRQVRWEFVNKGNLLGLVYTPYCLADLRIVKVNTPT